MRRVFYKTGAFLLAVILTAGIWGTSAMAEEIKEPSAEEQSVTEPGTALPENEEGAGAGKEEADEPGDEAGQENDGPEENDNPQPAELYLYAAGFDEAGQNYSIELRDAELSEGDSVVVPVWSDTGGQDDLKWNPAETGTDGSVKAKIKISDYKHPGLYYADFYKVDKTGNYHCIFSTTFEVPLPQSAVVETAEADPANGTATIRISEIDSPAGVKSVVVPTWSKSDQSDLRWYTAKKNEDGSYGITFKLADHKYNWAVYYSDVYVTDQNGFMSFVGGTTTDFSVKADAPEITLDEEKGVCTITMHTDIYPAGLKQMVVPVWSDAGGQDDLKWLNMTGDPETNTFTATFSTGFLKHSGKCFADIYANTASGKMVFMSGGTFENKGTTAESIEAVTDPSAGKFTVTVSGLKNLPEGAEIIVPVWCADDQSDIKWYTAVKKDGQYVVEGNVGNHKYSIGTYKADVYAKSAVMFFVGGTTFTFEASSGQFTLTDKYAGQSGKEQTEYTGTISGMLIPGGFSSISAAVWSDKNGQDDLKWYAMKRQSDGSYAFDLPIKNHKTSGQYMIDVYAVTKSGKNQFLVRYSDLNIDPVKYQATITVQNAKTDAGTFEVRIEDFTSVSGVSSVTVPVWTSQGGQDDLKWYTAKKQSDGSYLATVNAMNHKNRSGEYLVDVYATSGNGQFAYACGTKYDFKLADNAILVSDGLDEVTRTISIRNPSKTPVKFAVWSAAGKQKDLVWVEAANKGNGIWSATVKCSSFLKDGDYLVHVYSGSTCIKTGSFKWNANSAKSKLNSNQSMYNLAQGFSSDTQYLILVNRNLHRVAVYQGSKGNWEEIHYWPCVVGKPSTPTPAGTFKIKGRFDWFGDGHKCWWATQIEGYYYFHTQIYYWDDAPRRILDGTMDAAASMGCVRLQEPNARWIYTTISRGTTVHIYN